MSHLPLLLILFFLATVLVAVVLLRWAVRGARLVTIASLLWIGLQALMALSGFYLVVDTLPPRLALAAAPPLIVIAVVFLTRRGRRFVDSMSLKWCVLLHSIRILVEVNLYALFVYKQVPVQMTFESGNLDLLAGVSAPIIWWAFHKKLVGRTGLMVWNSLALLSVLNAFGRALLSAPFRFQQFAFDQPTVAILTLPFILLPAFLVPVVLFCHFAIFRKLLSAKQE